MTDPNDKPCEFCGAEAGELCAYSCRDAILTGREQEQDCDLDMNGTNDWESFP